MYIILDTSILVKDYRFKSQSIETIFSYLERCHHKLILPEIVIKELVEKFKRDLEEQNEKVSRINDSSKRFGVRTLDLLDIEKEVSTYNEFIKSTIKKKDIVVLPFNSGDYEKIINKAIKKMSPFKNKDGNDSGFKDAVVWESVVRALNTGKYEQICFITANSQDFSDFSDKDSLAPYLKNEIEKLPLKFKFQYFLSLEAFLEKYGLPLLGAVPKDSIQKAAIKYINEDLLEPEVEDLFSENSSYPIQNIDTSTLELNVEHFYVYKADSKNYYINATGIIKIWAVLYNPMDDDYFDDDIIARFNMSVEISKKDKKVDIKNFYTDSPEYF